MNRLDLLEALADAEEAIKRAGLVRLGPDGLEPVEEKPLPIDPRPIKKRWTGRCRPNSKQGRRERGGIV